LAAILFNCVLRLALRLLPAAFDPLADAISGDVDADTNTSGDHVHIRVQQRNGKKSLTTVRAAPFAACAALPAQRRWWHTCFACGVMCASQVQGLKQSYDYKKVLKALKKGASPRRLLPRAACCMCAWLTL
jgi:translation initiation factor 1 (eIF-1/SUI1)